MCKGSNEPGGPYRCSGDMYKALRQAMDKAVDARVAADQTEARMEACEARYDALAEDNPAVERLEDLADTADGTFEDSTRVAEEITRAGGYAVVEETKTYDPDSMVDGQVEYDDESYEVKVFANEADLDEYMENRYSTEGTNGDVAYGLDAYEDPASGQREEQTLFIHRPPTTTLQPSEVRVGDEVYENGQWSRVESVGTLGDRTKIEYSSGDTAYMSSTGTMHARPTPRDEEHEGRVATAKAQFFEARTEHRRSQTTLRNKRAALSDAQANYDATPRGIGELQLAADQARAHGDRALADNYEARIQVASDHIQQEEGQRRLNGERLGVPRGDIQFRPMSRGETSDTEKTRWMNAITEETQADGISACDKVRLAEPGTPSSPAMYEHKMTFTYATDFDTKEMTVTRTTSDSTPPSTSQVIGEIVNSSAYLNNNPDTTNNGNWSGERALVDRLKRFVGEVRFNQYLDVHAKNQG